MSEDPYKRVPVWRLTSLSDNRWICTECFLHCVKSSETNPVVCKEEDERPSQLEAYNSIRPQSV